MRSPWFYLAANEEYAMDIEVEVFAAQSTSEFQNFKISEVKLKLAYTV